MYVVRGSLGEPSVDRAATTELLDRVESDGVARLRIWQPPRQLAFGRRDRVVDGYDRAREIATNLGFPPVERSVGGRAVAHTGSTVAFAYAVSDDADIRSRYRDVTGLLERALGSLGVTARQGEPRDTFCPGDHSLRSSGKIVGTAQRVRDDAALVAGCVIVREADAVELDRVLTPVYQALSLPFQSGTVGSVEAAGGSGDPAATVEAIQNVFVRGREYEVRSVGSLE